MDKEYIWKDSEKREQSRPVALVSTLTSQQKWIAVGCWIANLQTENAKDAR